MASKKEEIRRTLKRAVSEAESAIGYCEEALDELSDLAEAELGLEKSLAAKVAYSLLAKHTSLPEDVRVFLDCICENKPMSEHLPGYNLLSA